MSLSTGTGSEVHKDTDRVIVVLLADVLAIVR